MRVTIEPGLLRGNVTVPPSKSHAHRLLIAAALTPEATRIHCPGENADIAATTDCLAALGARITRQEGHILISQSVTYSEEDVTIDCGESGSTLRFLLPLCAMQNRKITLMGHGRLPDRPNGPLLSALREHGAAIGGERLPLTLTGGLRAGDYRLPGNVSSQYFTGLLLALPMLPGDSVLRYTSPLESAPYVAMTLNVLGQFGVRIEALYDGWRVPGGQSYHSPGEAAVEGDWSSAAFWIGANALGSRIALEGLNPDSAQGDRAMGEMLGLLGGEINVSNAPDLMPILSVLCAAHPGKTRLTGGARLRLKESDRISAMAAALRALGGGAEETPDGLLIRGGPLRGGVVEGRGDHRVVMAAAIAATVCQGPVTILGAEATEKSYPGFFKEFARMGGILHGG